MAYSPRVFLDDCQIVPEELPKIVVLQDPFFVHHLRSVLRLEVGDRVDVVSKQQCYQGKWVSHTKTTITLELMLVQTVPSDPLPQVRLAVALLPDERWRWMLQKVTELGVHCIIPLLTERSKIRIQDISSKQARWQSIVTAAACQSEGLFIPTVSSPCAVPELLQQTQMVDRKLLLLERSNGRQPLTHWLAGMHVGMSLTVAIGPEAGWSPQEVDTFRQANYQVATLGQRVLRSETAAMSAMATVVAVSAQPDY